VNGLRRNEYSRIHSAYGFLSSRPARTNRRVRRKKFARTCVFSVVSPKETYRHTRKTVRAFITRTTCNSERRRRTCYCLKVIGERPAAMFRIRRRRRMPAAALIVRSARYAYDKRKTIITSTFESATRPRVQWSGAVVVSTRFMYTYDGNKNRTKRNYSDGDNVERKTSETFFILPSTRHARDCRLIKHLARVSNYCYYYYLQSAPRRGTVYRRGLRVQLLSYTGCPAVTCPTRFRSVRYFLGFFLEYLVYAFLAIES